ncbi:RNA 2'-phosphotransferase [Thalassocella blandensis]|nr:RNA 2'-phosphotransferase [Thalassocella blandensis]
MDKELTEISKYLSYILRHNPGEIGLKLDRNGWGEIDDIISKTSRFTLSYELISVVVETNDKQRFAIDEEGSKIRANQGHSIDLELDLPVRKPPEFLLHGTAERFWSSINGDGLNKGGRHHVHLTEAESVAKSVGSRYGKPILLRINSLDMHADGFSFYKTANNVWLVESVPPKYINKISFSVD